MTTLDSGTQTPRLEYVMCSSAAGTHRMAYREWGHPNNPNVVLCLHGLTRNGQDFSPLAKALSDRFRVVCPDIVGRGCSDWLLNPAHYVIPQYAADVLTLIARLQAKRLDWVGTSMGGLIVLALLGVMAHSAAERRQHPCSLAPSLGIPTGKIVLNDIGPSLNRAGLRRIATHLDKNHRFTQFDEAEDYIRETCASYGPQTDKDWHELTQSVFVRDERGYWVKHYDLAIAAPIAAQIKTDLHAGEKLLWQSYRAVTQPLLILRGEYSDLLTEQSANDMVKANANATLYEVAGVGHAPTLRSDELIHVLRDFLI